MSSSPTRKANPAALRAPVYGAIAGSLALFLVLRSGPWLSASQQSHLSDIAWALFSLAAALRCLVTANRHRRRRERYGWYLLAGSAFSWFLGMAYLIVRQRLTAGFPSYPTLANGLFLALAPLFTAGVFFLTVRDPARRVSWNRVANLGLVSIASLAGTLILLLDPLRESGGTFLLRFLSIADPAAFGIASLFTLTCIWLSDFEFRPAIGWLLFAAITLHAVADQLYFAGILAPENPAFTLDSLWLIAFALQFLAAYERDLDRITRSALERAASRDVQSPAEALLPPFLVVGTLLLGLAFRNHLSARLFTQVAPLVIAFALILGLKEWRTHRREVLLLRRLLEADARFRQVLAASPAVVFHCSPEPDHPATFLSREALIELGLKHPDPSLWAARVHPNDRDAIAGDFKQVLEAGSASSEYRLRDDEGVYRWVQRKMALLRDDKNRTLEIIGVMIDVSSTKRAEIQMLQGQRLEALGKLAGGIAHDFNNLLTTILMSAEMALDEPATSGVARASLETIEDAGEKAASLTSRLLTFSRQQHVELRTLDINRNIASMIDLLKRLIGEHIQIELEEHHPSVSVESDPGFLESVVMNLALNARDAMPSGGRLKIEIDRVLLDRHETQSHGLGSRGPYGLISVSDSGVGMSADTRSRIFDPFFSTKPMSQGTGLGLSTVYGIVKQHRGFIDVSSTEGVGSCFRVYLPLAKQPRENREAPAAAQPASGGTESLLIVDDDESILDLLDRALTALGYRVTTAGSAEEALSAVGHDAALIDLVLSDVVLPGLSGRQLVEALRRERPNLKAVFMTGYTDDSQLLGEVANGRLPLLRKPLSVGRLARTIRQVLDGAMTPA